MRTTAFALGLAGLLAGCTQAGANAQGRITGDEAKRLVAAGASLIDVRTPQEYAAGHIDGARNVPLGQLEASLGSIPTNKPVVVYCHSGNRSTVAASHLVAAGYEVHNLGAMSSWSP